MRYSKPRLHSLTDTNSTGNCVSGSSALEDSTCAVGPDIGTPFCTSGGSAAILCNPGNGAASGLPNPSFYCMGGTGAGLACADGGTASGCATGTTP